MTKACPLLQPQPPALAENFPLPWPLAEATFHRLEQNGPEGAHFPVTAAASRRNSTHSRLQSMSELLAKPKNCSACEKPDCDLRCACKLVYYCGPECQRKDWSSHKKKCTVALAKKIRDAKKEHGKDDVEVLKARMDAADALRLQGRYTDAERCYLDARRIAVDKGGKGCQDVGDISRCLGDLYSKTGRYGEATKLLQEALRIARSTEGERSNAAGEALHLMGDSLHLQGKFVEALSKLEEAEGIFKEAAAGPDHPYMANVLQSKGVCYYYMGRINEARSTYNECLRISRKVHGDDSEEVAALLQNLGNIYSDMNLLGDARAMYEEALEIGRRMHGERHPNVANSFNNIANVLDKSKQHDEAIKMHQKALKIRRRVLGENHQSVASSLMNMATSYFQIDKFEQALEAYEESLAVFTRALGPDTLKHANVNINMASAKSASGDRQGGLQNAREAVRIFKKLGMDHHPSAQQAATLLRYLERGA